MPRISFASSAVAPFSIRFASVAALSSASSRVEAGSFRLRSMRT